MGSSSTSYNVPWPSTSISFAGFVFCFFYLWHACLTIFPLCTGFMQNVMSQMRLALLDIYQVCCLFCLWLWERIWLFSCRVLLPGHVRWLFGKYWLLYTILVDDLADIIDLAYGTVRPSTAARCDALLARCQHWSHSRRALPDCEIHVRVHVRWFFLCGLCWCHSVAY